MNGYRKYKNKKCEADGFKFDSLKERAHYFLLKALQTQGKISGLNVHPTYFLAKEGVIDVVIRGDKRLTKSGRNTRASFELDFEYFDNDKALWVYEDVKSPATAKTDAFKLRRAIFEAIYQVEVTVIL